MRSTRGQAKRSKNNTGKSMKVINTNIQRYNALNTYQQPSVTGANNGTSLLQSYDGYWGVLSAMYFMFKVHLEI